MAVDSRNHYLAVLALSFAFSGCSGTAIEPEASAESTRPAAFNVDNAPTVEFSVPDMMCAEGCGTAVKEILAKQPGVMDVLVDFDAKLARVAIEEGKFDADNALAALVDRQFTNSSLKSDAIAKPQAAEGPSVPRSE